jgi:hypothetical protein
MEQTNSMQAIHILADLIKGEPRVASALQTVPARKIRRRQAGPFAYSWLARLWTELLMQIHPAPTAAATGDADGSDTKRDDQVTSHCSLWDLRLCHLDAARFYLGA